MIYSTATVPVNLEGETKLTRAQAWAGLELKARDARLFLPAGLCTRCGVVEESATHFVREATIGGADLREIITLDVWSGRVSQGVSMLWFWVLHQCIRPLFGAARSGPSWISARARSH